MALHTDVKKYYLFRALLKRFVVPILVLYGLDRGLTLGELSMALAGVFYEIAVTRDASAAYGYLILGSVVTVALIVPLVQLFRFQKREGERLFFSSSKSILE